MKKSIKISLVMALVGILGFITPLQANENIEQPTIETEVVEENLIEELETNEIVEELVQPEDNKELADDLIEEDIIQEEVEVKEEVIVDTEENKQVDMVKTLKSTVITNEDELQVALEKGQGELELLIQGGLEIELTQTLVVKTPNITKVNFVSSNDQEVVIKNTVGGRHIRVSGTDAISLNFNGVVLAGTSLSANGGIEIINNAVGNEINGLIIRNNISKTSYTGLVFFRSNTGGSLTINDSVFVDNIVSEWGANTSSMLFADLVRSNLYLNNVKFENTVLKNQNGGVVTITNSGGTVEMSDVSITNSTSVGKTGGIKYAGNKSANLLIEDSVFADNSNTYDMGGAFFLHQYDRASTVIRNTSFTNNFGHRGGGAMNILAEDDQTSIEFDNVSFDSNTGTRVRVDSETGVQTGVPSNGGAIHFYQSYGDSDFKIINSSFTNNETTRGGGLYHQVYSGAHVNTSIDNTIFDGNVADNEGGAILISYEDDNSTELLYSIKNTQIINNSVTGLPGAPSSFRGSYGAGIYFEDIITQENAIELDNVTFDNNKTNASRVWSYDASNDDVLSNFYREKIKNTTFSKGDSNVIESFNNALNNDDIFVDYDARTTFILNPYAIENLELQNYDETLSYSYSSILDHEIIAAVDPISTTHTFLGWYDVDGVKWDFETRQLETVYTYLYAQWEPKAEYTAVYNLNGAEGLAPSSETVLSGTLLTEPNTPVREGYTFMGWSLVQDDASKLWNYVSDTISNTNIELFAQWKINDIELPEEPELPEIQLPGIEVPSIEVPEVIQPEIIVPVDPEVTLPTVTKPEIETEKLPATGIENNTLLFSTAMILTGLVLIVVNKRRN